MLNWLPWLLMMKRPGHKFTRHSLYKVLHKPSANGTGQYLDGDSLMRNMRFSDDNSYVGFNSSKPTEKEEEQPFGRVKRVFSADLETRLVSCLQNASTNPQLMDQGSLSMLLTMQQIYSEVKFIARRMEREDEVQEAKNDWRFAAMVVDRLCLVLFTGLIILSTCGIFFAAPYLVA